MSFFLKRGQKNDEMECSCNVCVTKKQETFKILDILKVKRTSLEHILFFWRCFPVQISFRKTDICFDLLHGVQSRIALNYYTERRQSDSKGLNRDRHSILCFYERGSMFRAEWNFDLFTMSLSVR